MHRTQWKTQNLWGERGTGRKQQRSLNEAEKPSLGQTLSKLIHGKEIHLYYIEELGLGELQRLTFPIIELAKNFTLVFSNILWKNSNEFLANPINWFLEVRNSDNTYQKHIAMTYQLETGQ